MTTKEKEKEKEKAETRARLMREHLSWCAQRRAYEAMTDLDNALRGMREDIPRVGNMTPKGNFKRQRAAAKALRVYQQAMHDMALQSEGV